MRHEFYVLLVSIGLVLSLSLLSFAIDCTGLWRLMEVDPVRFVLFSLAAGWIGGFACWFLSRSIAIWSLDVKPMEGGHPSVEKVAQALGMKRAPDVASYDTEECNAFAVGWLPSRSLIVLSTGLLAQKKAEDIEAIVAQRLAAVKNRDVSALTLFNGVLNVFTVLNTFTSTMRIKDVRPLFTWFSMMGTNVCTPVRPEAQLGHGRNFASRACGAWSDPIVSTVPSFSAFQTASICR